MKLRDLNSKALNKLYDQEKLGTFYAQLRQKMHAMFHEGATREAAQAEATARYHAFAGIGAHKVAQQLARGVGKREIRQAWKGAYCTSECGKP